MPTNDEFAIHLNEFDGPLALLLHLIKQSKMNIYDIQIESITKQYVDYLDQMKALNIDLVSEYFVMASNLMAIKSKLLLPAPPELDADDEDPRDELVNQLIVYQVYKQHANDLKQRYARRSQLHSRAEVVPNYANGLIEPENKLDLQLLTKAFHRVINNNELETNDAVEISEWQYSVASQTEWLLEQLQVDNQLDLTVVFKDQPNLEALITTFLAVLEMIKQHQIAVGEVNSRIKITQLGGDENE
ncbi:segregation and condensation protein A [Nicoliella lavandulae]|uniref:Segregation and condensation protein A n=1 Tax=Nicoliella lavandulae TaxID=3082954 RepID=A0ABU8SL86_9LACO